MNQATCEPRWTAIADRLIQRRFLFLVIASAVGLLAFLIGSRFVLERRLESMFRPDDPVLTNYRQLRDAFGGNEVILIVFADEDFWDPKERKLSELKTLHDAIEALDGIRGVMDLTVVDRLIQNVEGPMSMFGINPNETGIYSQSHLASAMRDLFIGTTHAAKGPWLAIACLLDPLEDARSNRSKLIAALHSSMDELLPNKKVFLVGEPIMVEEGFEMIEADGRRLGWISSIVLAILMLVVYRNVRWTILTLLVVQWSLQVTRAICVVAGWELTMVSSMLVAIVTVIGIATSMHWLFGYQKRLRCGDTHSEALQSSLRLLVRPIAWACITDALAFAALMAARVEPVRDYGLMMAVASMSTLLAILMIGPGLASLGVPKDARLLVGGNRRTRKHATWLDDGPESPSYVGNGQEAWIDDWLKRSLHFFLRQRKLTLAFLVAWVVFVFVGSSRLTVETDFLKNFRQDSLLVQGYSVVEQQLGGAGVWDVLLPAPSQLTNEYLQSVIKLEEELRQLEGGLISNVVSLADAEMAARHSTLLATLPIEVRLAGMQAAMPSFFDSLVTSADGRSIRTLRIMLRASERISVAEKLRLISLVEECCKRTTQSSSWREHFSTTGDSLLRHPSIVTGYYVLLANLVQSVVADQWICFAIATLAILIALRIATNSWKLSSVALVPNTLPALGAMAALGILDLKMNLGAAMIAAVSIGLSVDSSLHYLIDYQRSRKAGLTSIAALERSQTNVGVPVMLSTIALILGFASLAMSEFLPTVVFGSMSAITMAVGLIGNLWWLPVLIDWVEESK